MHRDYKGYNYHSFKAKFFFLLIWALKSKEKKLALTPSYCIDQATGLDDSWKLIHINQSRSFTWENSKFFN